MSSLHPLDIMGHDIWYVCYESVFPKQTCLLAHQKLYQKDWDEAKQKGYDLRADAIEIKHAKASREIASEVTFFCLLWGFLLRKTKTV